MQNIRILVQSFFSQKKINLAKKKFLATQLFILQKKNSSRVYDPFSIKLFFGVGEKQSGLLQNSLCFSILFSVYVTVTHARNLPEKVYVTKVYVTVTHARDFPGKSLRYKSLRYGDSRKKLSRKKFTLQKFTLR